MLALYEETLQLAVASFPSSLFYDNINREAAHFDRQLKEEEEVKEREKERKAHRRPVKAI